MSGAGLTPGTSDADESDWSLMTEQPQQAAPPAAPAPPAAEPAQHAGFFDKLVHHGETAQPAPPVTPAEIAHLRGVMDLAAAIIEDPAFRPLLPKALEALVAAAGLAGKALG